MKLLKKIRKSRYIRIVAGWLIAQYVRLVWLTVRWQFGGATYSEIGWSNHRPLLTCFWHGRMLMMFKAWQGSRNFNMLISSHPDGEIIARATESFGYRRIAGSSNRKGSEALRNIIKVLKKGESVGITPDGPRGPRYQSSLGIIQIARLTKTPIFPMTYSSTWAFIIKSWDRFFLPLPFGRGVILYGKPISIHDASGSDEELRQLLDKTLNNLTIEADRLCGWHNEAEIPRGDV